MEVATDDGENLTLDRPKEAAEVAKAIESVIPKVENPLKTT